MQFSVAGAVAVAVVAAAAVRGLCLALAKAPTWNKTAVSDMFKPALQKDAAGSAKMPKNKCWDIV